MLGSVMNFNFQNFSENILDFLPERSETIQWNRGVEMA